MINLAQWLENDKVSMEVLGEEPSTVENEATIYIRVADPISVIDYCRDNLPEGSKYFGERHEQWEAKFNGSGNDRLRVRRTEYLEVNDVNKVVEYSMALKNAVTKLETEIETPAEMFIEFRKVCRKGMIKQRYTIPTGFMYGEEEEKQTFWELDFYFDENGDFIHWIKVDLEIPPGGFKGEVPKFPLEWEEVLTDSKNHEAVTQLYDQYFLKKK